MALPPGRRATRSPLPLPLGVGLWANKWVIKGLQGSMLECIGVLVGMGVNNHGGPFFGKFLSLRVKNYSYIVGPYIYIYWSLLMEKVPKFHWVIYVLQARCCYGSSGIKCKPRRTQ